MRRREIRVSFRLSEKEKIHLDKLVQQSGFSREEYLRNLIGNYYLIPKPDENFYEKMKVLCEIGKLLNNLVAKSHSLGFIDSPLLRQYLKKLEDIELNIKEEILKKRGNQNEEI